MKDTPPLARKSGRNSPTYDQTGLRWMYLLAAVPILTDLIETGRVPASPREWITEVIAGAVIAALVRKARIDRGALVVLSRTDSLTGLGNRRAFDEAIENECARSHRSRQPLSLVYIDLDHFKQVNDRDGHDKGDRLLQQLAAAIGGAVRARVDRGFRTGGDEFALLLPGSMAAQAEEVAMRIKERCASADPAWANGSLGFSAGIVELDLQEAATEFVRRADAAMYAKKLSRGRGETRTDLRGGDEQGDLAS